MPPRNQTTRLESLGSKKPEVDAAQRASTDASSSLASRFRPKNFSKPVVKKEERGVEFVQVKGEEQQEGSSKRKGKTKGSARGKGQHHKKTNVVGQDQVVFGGGVGVASCAPQKTRTTAQGSSRAKQVGGDGAGSTQTGRITSDLEGNLPVRVKKEEQEDWNEVSSSSSDSEMEMEGGYAPMVLDFPERVARDVAEIDTQENAIASESTAGLFKFRDDAGPAFHLIQLPGILPLAKTSSNVDAIARATGCLTLEELSGQSIGKLLIMRSGRVKLKIGDMIMDVTASVATKERQDFACIDSENDEMVILGPVTERVTVTPDTDALLDEEKATLWTNKYKSFLLSRKMA